MLKIISKQATPRQWVKYSNTSAAIKLINTSNTQNANSLLNYIYINDRKPNRRSFIDKSRLKIGLQNRLPYLRLLPLDRLRNYNDNYIRTNLKKTFFMYWQSCTVRYIKKKRLHFVIIHVKFLFLKCYFIVMLYCELYPI